MLDFILSFFFFLNHVVYSKEYGIFLLLGVFCFVLGLFFWFFLGCSSSCFASNLFYFSWHLINCKKKDFALFFGLIMLASFLLCQLKESAPFSMS